MLCIVVWDIQVVPRVAIHGHVPGNVRTLRRYASRVAYALGFRTSGVR
jgi:hypothetical protein